MSDPSRSPFAHLVGRPLTRPQVGRGVTGPELNDGTHGVRSVPANDYVAEGYVSTSGNTITEEWVVLREVDFLQAGLATKLTDPNVETLPAARRTALKAEAQQTGRTYLYGKFSYSYAPLPTAAMIAALPTTPTPNTTSFLYELRCNAGGVPSTVVAGLMFRERSIGAPPANYVEHWVMYDTYFAPMNADTLGLTPVTGGNRPTTVRAFLEAQRALYDAAPPAAQLKWRYAQLLYGLAPLT